MNNSFSIHIHNRDYSEYEFTTSDHENIKLDVDPIRHKLFHDDVFTINEDNTIRIHTSNVRSMNCIPGVLVLHGNQTYGRTANKKRLLYKCIPYDHRLPHFLVPYDPSLEFSKVIYNKYVLFTFQQWDAKHPHGVLVESLGNVNDVNALADYELYGNHLQYSLKDVTKIVQTRITDHDEMIEQIIHDKKYKMQHKTSQYVFSIDPAGSLDYDDAFAIEKKNERTVVTVHIANVAIWMEHFQLWSSLSGRVSTIYFPQSKKTMLPTMLSDQICSLRQKQRNVTMFVEFPLFENGSIDFDNVTYGNSIVKVCKNFDYEEQKLLKNEHYQNLLSNTKNVDASIHDSHDVVSFWMIQVNAFLAKKMHDYDVGILRVSSLKYNERTKLDFDKTTRDALFHYKNASANYVSTRADHLKHSVMNQDIYTHITSPIRRTVDLVNQLILLYRNHLMSGLSVGAQQYMINWTSNLEKINQDTKKIKFIQNKLQLLHQCETNSELLDEHLHGIVVDKKIVDTMFHYTMFLPTLRVFLPSISDKELIEYDQCRVQVFLFEDENNIRNKIKIQIL